MALAYEDSRMSMDSELSNLSPCKPCKSVATNDNETTAATTTTTTTNISLLLSTKKHCFLNEETEASSASDFTVKDSHQETKPGGAAKTRISESWIDIVAKEEEAERDSEKKGELAVCKSGSETKMSMDENSNSNASVLSTGSGRQIEIDILDSANVEKYEKLVRDEKIKSPFKRRLSGGGEDDEAGDGHATFDDVGQTAGGTSQCKKTKTDENDHGRERFRRESSSSSGDGSSQSSRKPIIEFETDMSILVRRQKQIDYGKNTLGYENYLKQVPRDKRTIEHPKTPPKQIKYSRRAWDGVIKVWRKQLHCFDPNGQQDADD